MNKGRRQRIGREKLGCCWSNRTSIPGAAYKRSQHDSTRCEIPVDLGAAAHGLFRVVFWNSVHGSLHLVGCCPRRRGPGDVRRPRHCRMRPSATSGRILSGQISHAWGSTGELHPASACLQLLFPQQIGRIPRRRCCELNSMAIAHFGLELESAIVTCNNRISSWLSESLIQGQLQLPLHPLNRFEMMPRSNGAESHRE